MKRVLFVLFLSLLLFVLHVTQSSKDKTEYQRLSLQQRIAERFRQEADFTRDPKTNDVPTERLIKAKDYTQKKLREKGPVAGINWTERGPTNVSGRTRSILFDANDPTGRTLWTGGMGGGLWKSTDDGQSWNPVNEFFNSMTITSIVQDPQNPNIIYFGTGESVGSAGRGMGIWKSTNGGNNFYNIPFTSNQRSFDFINKLEIQVYQGNSVLYAATSSTDSSKGGLLYSYDDGLSWDIFRGNNSGVHNFCTDVEVTPSGRVLAGFGGMAQINTNLGTPVAKESDGVYFSDNGGFSWSLLRQSQPYESRVEIAVSPDDPFQYYLLFENTLPGGIPTLYRSTVILNTIQWVPIIAPTWIDCNRTVQDFTRNQDFYDLAIEVYPGFPNSLLVGGIDLFLYQANIDQFTGLFLGETWTQLSNWQRTCQNYQYIHADQHGIFFKNSNEVYVANDGGIFKSNNAAVFGGLDFTFLGNSLNVTQFYAADIDPRAGVNYYIAGSQDNGTVSMASPGMDPGTEVKGGDGMFCHIDQTNHNIQIVSNFNQFMHATNNSWQTSVQVGTQNKGRFVNPMEYDDINKKVYAADVTGTYLRWENPSTGGSTLTTVNVNGFPTNLQDNLPWHVRISPNVAGRVYFGFNDGTVRRVENANTGTSKTSTTIFNLGLGEGHAVSCVDVEDGNENHMIVTLSNYGITSVYESYNATAASPTWTPIEGNLPDMPVRWAMINPVNPDQAFLATELGVWSTDNLNGSNTSWSPTNAGLANTRIDMIKHRKSDFQMVVATHGRGLYTSNDLGAECNGMLTLNNQTLSGAYNASTSISVQNSSITGSAALASPNITFQNFTVNNNAQLTVASDGCQ